ncbi:MAG: hypothetical protein AAF585_05045, partial [Verrucomicrobiota bacterium]
MFVVFAIVAVSMQPRPEFFASPAIYPGKIAQTHDAWPSWHQLGTYPNHGDFPAFLAGTEFSKAVQMDIPDAVGQFDPKLQYPDIDVEKLEGHLRLEFNAEEKEGFLHFDAVSDASGPRAAAEPLGRRSSLSGFGGIAGRRTAGVHIPEADDSPPFSYELPTESLTVRSADVVFDTTTRVLSSDELEELGIPEGFLQICPVQLNRPALRLFLCRQQLLDFRLEDVRAFDLRTGVEIGAPGLFQDARVYETDGDWSIVDLRLEIWHDTPVRIALDMLSGQLQEAKLKLSVNQQVVLDEKVRIGSL